VQLCLYTLSHLGQWQLYELSHQQLLGRNNLLQPLLLSLFLNLLLCHDYER
jgi:hypothetical protein